MGNFCDIILSVPKARCLVTFHFTLGFMANTNKTWRENYDKQREKTSTY